MIMKEHIARLTSDSAVYGISAVLGRFLNFLLVPFYTNIFPADEYGLVTVAYSFIAFLNVVYALGFETAFMRFLEARREADRADVFSAPFWTIAAAAAAFSAAIALSENPLSDALLIPREWSAIVPLSAAILALDALNVIPFAALRMDRRAGRFAAIRLAGILVNIALNLILVLGLRMSIVAVFISNLAASAATTLLLAPVIVRDLRPRVKPDLLRAMLAFGLPTIPAGISAMLIQVVDRPLIQRIAGDAAAGVYGANYRLGIIMMLVVTMFQYAWQPFALQSASMPEARRLFARVMTYFVLAGSLVTAAGGMFIDDVAVIPLIHGKALLGSAYREGLSIVPIVLFSYLWTGIGAVLTAGLLIEKRTAYLALVTAVGAAVNVAVNLLLIPPLGYTGGALATLASYVCMTALYWFISRRVYPVEWEYARIGKILLALAATAALWYSGLRPIPMPALLWEGALFLGFVFLLFAMKLFLPSELREMRAFLRLKNRATRGT